MTPSLRLLLPGTGYTIEELKAMYNNNWESSISLKMNQTADGASLSMVQDDTTITSTVKFSTTKLDNIPKVVTDKRDEAIAEYKTPQEAN